MGGVSLARIIMDDARTRPGVGNNGTATAADCDLVQPVTPLSPIYRPMGIVVNRDHVVGFIVGAGLLAAAYWIFKKCED